MSSTIFPFACLARRVFPAIVPLLPLALAAPAAHAQANLIFSGGSGSPLTIALTAPVTYIVTTAPARAPFFAFAGVGNLFGGIPPIIDSTLAYSVNGTQRTIGVINSGNAGGSLSANDVYAYSSAFPSVNVGDTVVLFAGSVTTDGTVAAAAPASGSYTTFLFDSNGTRISNNGVAGTPAAAAAPEPSALELLVPALSLAGMIVRRRRKATASA